MHLSIPCWFGTSEARTDVRADDFQSSNWPTFPEHQQQKPYLETLSKMRRTKGPALRQEKRLLKPCTREPSVF